MKNLKLKIRPEEEKSITAHRILLEGQKHVIIREWISWLSYEGQEYIIELKVWHGSDYRQKGVEQLKGYMDARNCRKGYLISFNFNKEKEYIQNKIYLGNGQKEIFEIVV